ncbi:MAG: dienelactone hydrolase family protein [Acidobacteriota bacterium]
MSNEELHLIATPTHGRVIVRRARAAASRGLLVGFHGYMETAELQMERLGGIPGASTWTLVSVQGLHCFYRGRTQQVVASWMTRQDREAAIADNLEYVASALDAAPHDDETPIVYAGFSQGVAMAFRAAVRGRRAAAGVIGVGGDIPPELLADSSVTFPPVLLARGERDAWLTPDRFDADTAALRSRNVPLASLVFDGAHEWNAAVSAAAGEFLAGL